MHSVSIKKSMSANTRLNAVKSFIATPGEYIGDIVEATKFKFNNRKTPFKQSFNKRLWKNFSNTTSNTKCSVVLRDEKVFIHDISVLVETLQHELPNLSELEQEQINTYLYLQKKSLSKNSASILGKSILSIVTLALPGGVIAQQFGERLAPSLSQNISDNGIKSNFNDCNLHDLKNFNIDIYELLSLLDEKFTRFQSHLNTPTTNINTHTPQHNPKQSLLETI